MTVGTAALAPEPEVESAIAIDEPAVGTAETELTVESLRNAVLSALEEANQQMLAHNLESGEWTLRGNELSAKVAMSQVMCDVALGDSAKRVVNGALQQAARKPVKFKMVSGGSQFAPKAETAPRPSNGVGARSRAMSDPVVQRMQGKFGAEIRSVIDHKERG